MVGWGLLDARAVGTSTPLVQHLTAYKQALLDGVASPMQKGPATPKHAETVLKRVQTPLDVIGARFLSDVRAEDVGRYLAKRRTQQPANPKERERLSVQTSNHWLTNAKSFFNWLVRAKRAPENPLASVHNMQVTPKTRKFVRRALEHDEGARLLDAARRGPVRYDVTGEERYWLYRLALETGLRSSELRALTRRNLELAGRELYVWLPSDDTKNRRGAELPLRPGTVAELRVFLDGKHDAAPVFPNMPADYDMADMLRGDLEAAGIPFEIDSGRVDFHSLRVTCLSWLADAGTSLRTLQEFARRSTPTLTMNVYARTLRGSLADAARRLPDLSGPARQKARATGTYNVRPTAEANAGCEIAPDCTKRGSFGCSDVRRRARFGASTAR